MSLTPAELKGLFERAAKSVEEDLVGHHERVLTPLDQTFLMEDGRFYQIIVMEADQTIFDRE